MLLAIDIGGTKLAAALVREGVISARRQVPMARDAAGFAAAIDALMEGWPAPERISVATTGYVDGGKVYPVNRSIISFWNGFPLEQLLRERFGCRVTLFNDAQRPRGENTAPGATWARLAIPPTCCSSPCRRAWAAASCSTTACAWGRTAWPAMWGTHRPGWITDCP